MPLYYRDDKVLNFQRNEQRVITFEMFLLFTNCCPIISHVFTSFVRTMTGTAVFDFFPLTLRRVETRPKTVRVSQKSVVVVVRAPVVALKRQHKQSYKCLKYSKLNVNINVWFFNNS